MAFILTLLQSMKRAYVQTKKGELACQRAERNRERVYVYA
jgi:hypothetical protein